MEKILLNKIRCNHCKVEIESVSRHDLKRCNCGKCYVEGGFDLLKRGFTDYGDYTELSITEPIKNEE